MYPLGYAAYMPQIRQIRRVSHSLRNGEDVRECMNLENFALQYLGDHYTYDNQSNISELYSSMPVYIRHIWLISVSIHWMPAISKCVYVANLWKMQLQWHVTKTLIGCWVNERGFGQFKCMGAHIRYGIEAIWCTATAMAAQKWLQRHFRCEYSVYADIPKRTFGIQIDTPRIWLRYAVNITFLCITYFPLWSKQ